MRFQLRYRFFDAVQFTGTTESVEEIKTFLASYENWDGGPVVEWHEPPTTGGAILPKSRGKFDIFRPGDWIFRKYGEIGSRNNRDFQELAERVEEPEP